MFKKANYTYHVHRMLAVKNTKIVEKHEAHLAGFPSQGNMATFLVKQYPKMEKIGKKIFVFFW